MRRAARVTTVLGAVLVAFLASCFTKPGQPHLNGGDDDDGGLRDANLDGAQTDAPRDAPPGTCANTDKFETGTGCGVIGTSYGPSGIVGRSNNQLSMAATGSAGGCHSSAAFNFAAGTSIKVVQLSQSAMTNTTSLSVYNGTNAAEGMQVVFNNAMGTSIVFDAQCIGSVSSTVELPYDPVAQLYWKFAPAATAQGTSVHAYYSADGSTWTDTTVSCTWSSVATVKVDIGVGASAASTNQLALFDDFNVKTCP